MTRRDLQNISRLRIQEAKLLLINSSYSGAYYLAGYSVECGLKACIERQMRQSNIPE
jgi:HEPN domain-containing protein